MWKLLSILALISFASATNITCDKCIDLVSKTENLLYLADEYAAFACAVVTPPERPSCIEMAEAVVPFLIVEVLENYQPEHVCRQLEFCPKRWCVVCCPRGCNKQAHMFLTAGGSSREQTNLCLLQTLSSEPEVTQRTLLCILQTLLGSGHDNW